MADLYSDFSFSGSSVLIFAALQTTRLFHDEASSFLFLVWLEKFVKVQ